MPLTPTLLLNQPPPIQRLINNTIIIPDVGRALKPPVPLETPSPCALFKTAQAFSKQTQSTPMAPANTGSIDIDIIIERQQKILAAEFFRAHCESKTFAHNLYRDPTTQAAVDRFLLKSTQWVQLHGEGSKKGSKKRGYWKNLPANVATESDLYAVYRDIFADILLGHDQEQTTCTRTIQDTHNKRLPHLEREGYTLGSKPDFIVEATGPSFEVPFENPDKSKAKCNFGYTNAITAIEIKTDSAKGTGASLMGQVAIYARYGHASSRPALL